MCFQDVDPQTVKSSINHSSGMLVLKAPKLALEGVPKEHVIPITLENSGKKRLN
jgi:hypothetical protein